MFSNTFLFSFINVQLRLDYYLSTCLPAAAPPPKRPGQHVTLRHTHTHIHGWYSKEVFAFVVIHSCLYGWISFGFAGIFLLLLLLYGLDSPGCSRPSDKLLICEYKTILWDNLDIFMHKSIYVRTGCSLKTVFFPNLLQSIPCMYEINSSDLRSACTVTLIGFLEFLVKYISYLHCDLQDH